MARKPISELKETPEWLSLTLKQRKFLELYVANGYDAKAAYFSVYDCKDEHTAHCASYARLQSPKVAMFLHLHFNGDPEDVFIKLIMRMILNKKLTPEQVEVMKIYAPLVRRSGTRDTAQKAEKAPTPSAPLESIDLKDFD